MKLKIKLEEGGKLPVRATEGAVAYDAFVRKYEITKEGMIKYYLGFAMELDGYRCIVAARSSLSDTIYCFQAGQGVIDEDYRGEVQFRIRPIIDLRSNQFFAKDIVEATIPYKEGDRCCQIYFEKVEDVEFEEVEELSVTDRGGNGFGSTKK